ncbi:MAG: phosphoribosylglycinamide formyltransferase [Pikeienuella sp.]
MSRKRAAIFISGRGSNMVSLLAAMKTADYPVEAALVLSNNPEAPGLALAAGEGVATAAIDHRPFKGDRAGFEAKIQETLAAERIDLICLAGFLRILTGGFVEQWRDRMINIHPSLLPSFKGLHSHERVLEAGVGFHGCTVHLVRAEMDDGPILGQAALAVQAGESADALGARVLELEHKLYPAALAAYVSGELRLAGERIAPGPLTISG